MSGTPEQIVQCLDQLELHSDDPVKVARLVVELRARLHDVAVGYVECAELAVLLTEERDDLLRQLAAICREPV